MNSLAPLKGHSSHQILSFHSTLSIENFSSSYLIMPAFGLSSLLFMRHLFLAKFKRPLYSLKKMCLGQCILNNPPLSFYFHCQHTHIQ